VALGKRYGHAYKTHASRKIKFKFNLSGARVSTSLIYAGWSRKMERYLFWKAGYKKRRNPSTEYWGVD